MRRSSEVVSYSQSLSTAFGSLEQGTIGATDVSRQRLFGSLCSMVFLVNLARIVFSPLLEPLKAYFGVTEATIGLLATLVWFGSASPRLFVGYALTKVPRHYMVLAAGSILTISSAFISVAQSIEVLMIGGFCLGLASGPYFIAANPIISELFPEQVGNVLGIHGMASQFAAVAAAPLVVWTLSVRSWRLTFQLIRGRRSTGDNHPLRGRLPNGSP